MSELISFSELENKQTLKYERHMPNKVSISGKEIDGKTNIFGKEIKGRTGDTVIYFGGTFETPNSKSTNDLKQSLADYSGNTCYSFLATANPEEVFKFIEEKGLNNIVLVGYSQGAMRAVELTKKLEERGKVTNGLILLEPTSLYEQKNLFKNFMGEISETVKSLGIYKERSKKTYQEKELTQKGIYLLKEGITNGVPKLIGIKGKNGLSLKDQIKNMSLVHPNLGEINSRIVIIQGNHDKVSSPKKTNLKVFERSEKISQITASYLDTHFLPMFRSEQVAKVGLKLLHRK